MEEEILYTLLAGARQRNTLKLQNALETRTGGAGGGEIMSITKHQKRVRRVFNGKDVGLARKIDKVNKEGDGNQSQSAQVDGPIKQTHALI